MLRNRLGLPGHGSIVFLMTWSFSPWLDRQARLMTFLYWETQTAYFSGSGLSGTKADQKYSIKPVMSVLPQRQFDWKTPSFPRVFLRCSAWTEVPLFHFILGLMTYHMTSRANTNACVLNTKFPVIKKHGERVLAVCVSVCACHLP